MKIGFIAMSGVRVFDPELMELGLTLPGFVDRGQTIAELPSLGLLTLAGLTPESVEMEYVEVPDLSEVDGLPGAFDVVAISALSAGISDGYELVRRYREVGTQVVMGGLHVSACPEEALQHADAIVIGEGEPLWPQVIEDLLHNRLQRIYDARPTPFDFSNAPMPRFDLLDPARYNRLSVQSQRGCPFSCEFCAASIRICPKYKIKPLEKVIDEVRAIKSIWPHPFIEFADDNGFVNKPRSRALMRALAEEGVRWFSESDIAIADDPELLRLMHDSGCSQVLIGLESTSVAGLDGLEQKGNWKARQRDHYLESIAAIQDHGITVNGCFILGLDGTGEESFEQIARFVEESGLYEVQITLLTPFPGTPLYDRLASEGRLLHPGDWQRCTLFDLNFRPDSMSAEALEGGLRNLMRTIYSESQVGARREGFRRRLREVRRQQRSAAA